MTRTMTRTRHTTAGEAENRKPENPAVKQQPTIIRTVIIVITKAYSLYNIAQQSYQLTISISEFKNDAI